MADSPPPSSSPFLRATSRFLEAFRRYCALAYYLPSSCFPVSGCWNVSVEKGCSSGLGVIGRQRNKKRIEKKGGAISE